MSTQPYSCLYFCLPRGLNLLLIITSNSENTYGNVAVSDRPPACNNVMNFFKCVISLLLSPHFLGQLPSLHSNSARTIEQFLKCGAGGGTGAGAGTGGRTTSQSLWEIL